MSKKKKEAEDIDQNGQHDPIEETADTSIKNQEEELAEIKDKYLRLFAEFDNYKKRTARERLDLIRTASEDLVARLLPVLDDFDLAKKNADDQASPETFTEEVLLV